MSAHRYGNFSSSEIHKLMTDDKKGGFGKPAITYIKEKQMELRLGRSLSTETASRPALWGILAESYVNDVHVGIEYELVSNERISHESISNWNGCPDLLSDDCCADIKAPQLKNFCLLSEICLSGDVFELKESFPEYFYQLVSGCILAKKEYAELIVFCPYQHELAEIRKNAADSGDDKFKWISYADDSELPYLPEGGFYKNIARLKFKPTEHEKELLTNRVKLAVNMLLGERKAEIAIS